MKDAICGFLLAVGIVFVVVFLMYVIYKDAYSTDERKQHAVHFKYEGHEYICFSMKRGVVHNPDCKCMNNTNTEVQK